MKIRRNDNPRGTGPMYLVSLAGIGTSADTSWRYAANIMHLPWPERFGVAFVLELALFACGYALAQHARRQPDTRPPVSVTGFLWSLVALSLYMAVSEFGPDQAIFRVVAVAAGIYTLHLALGIEIRARRAGQRAGTLARVGREVRERMLSRLGLADDNRDAAARTRDRAVTRAARLAVAHRAPFRRSRLGRAVRSCGAVSDPATRARLVDQVAALRHLDDLAGVAWPSPWTAGLDLAALVPVSPAVPAAPLAEVGPDHRAALANLDTGRARVRYALDHLGPTSRPADLRGFLAAHGVTVSASEITAVRKEYQPINGRIPAIRKGE